MLREAVYRASATVSLVLACCGIVACGNIIDAEVDSGLPIEATIAETRLRVKIEPIRRARLEVAGSVTGTVRAFHRARITAETQGRVIARVVEPGARLAAGAVLVALENSRLALELRRSEAALRLATTIRAHADREFERGERLIAESAISTRRSDEFRLALDRASDEVILAEVARDTAKRNLEDARIEAPFDGSVDSIDVNVGDFVSPGTPVARSIGPTRRQTTSSTSCGLLGGTPATTRSSPSPTRGRACSATSTNTASTPTAACSVSMVNRASRP